jgi:enoyl-CoA hydratase/carnithine racemase
MNNASQGEAVLLRQDEAGVATLTMNRADQFNALSEALLAALQNALDAIANDPQVRVVVLAGAGRAFCAGHDLKEMRANIRREYYQELFQRCGKVMSSIVRLPQPVIARVHGTATAAGCQLVASCDLAVAADKAKFAVSGVNLGLFCSTPAVALSLNVSRKQAFEMLVTGNFIDAATAVRQGLVNRAVPAGELDAAINEYTRSIVGKLPVAVTMGKQLFYQQIEQGLDTAYQLASGVMACNMVDEDTGEGIDAFIEKRPPAWKREQD